MKQTMRPRHRFVDFVEENRHHWESSVALSCLWEHPEYLDIAEVGCNLYLSANPSYEAVHMLKQNPRFVYRQLLSANTNPEAVKMLKNNPALVYWPSLSANPSAMELINDNAIAARVAWIYAVFRCKLMVRRSDVVFDRLCANKNSRNRNCGPQSSNIGRLEPTLGNIMRRN